ncbi:MAG: hypothetical protein WBD31_03400, partial [Rubripirellula sp.]
ELGPRLSSSRHANNQSDHTPAKPLSRLGRRAGAKLRSCDVADCRLPSQDQRNPSDRFNSALLPSESGLVMK